MFESEFESGSEDADSCIADHDIHVVELEAKRGERLSEALRITYIRLDGESPTAQCADGGANLLSLLVAIVVNEG